MEISKIVEEAGRLSLFEIAAVIRQLCEMLDDPKRVWDVRERLRPGMRVRHFDSKMNRLVDCEILELKRTTALVRHDDGERWTIHLFAFLLDGIEPPAPPPDFQPGGMAGG